MVVGTAVACGLPALFAGARLDRWAERAFAELARPEPVFGLVTGLLALDPVLPVPSSVVATVAGQRLGFAGATASIALGLNLGCLAGYLLGRLAAAPVVQRIVGVTHLERARERVTTRPGALALAVTRPVPILSEATIVLAGAAHTPPAWTAAWCGLANLGLAVVYAALGSAADGGAALPLAIAGSVGVPLVAAAAAMMVFGGRERSPEGRRREHR